MNLLQTNWLSKTTRHLKCALKSERRILFSSLIFVASALSVACVPKNTPLTQSSFVASNGPTYDGFNGLESVQTTGPEKVQLNWSVATDPRVVGYNIYDTTLISNPKLVATVPVSKNTTTLSGLVNEKYYTFRLKATTSFAKTGVEDGNLLDLPAIPYAGIGTTANVLSSTSAQISFADATASDKVEIFCHTPLAPLDTLIGEVTDVTQTTYNLTSLTAGVLYTCRAALSIGGFIDNNTASVTFTPIGTASQLIFTSQPGSAQSGMPLATQPVVKILDVNGNPVSAGPDSTAQISLTIAADSPTSGSLRGTTTVTAVAGVATFTSLSILEAGLKAITVTKSSTISQPHGSNSITAESNQFVISPGNVSPLTSTITVTPSGSLVAPLVADGTSAYIVTFLLKDANNNPIAGVKPTFNSTDADTLNQPTLNTDATGTTTGTITTTVADMVRSLAIDSPAGLSQVSVVAPFIAGAATQLAFTSQPQNAGAGNYLGNVAVAVEDRYGNIVSTGTASSVTLAINANTGGATLSGTNPANTVSGIANYNNLSINIINTGYKLIASSGALTPAYSNVFNVTAASPQKISVFVTAPSVNTVLSGACSTAITFQLQDSGGNRSNAIQATPINVSGLGGGALYASSACTGTPQSSTITFTASSNTKTFYIKDPKAEALTITASDPSSVLTSGTMGFTVNPDKLAIAATSSTVVAGKCSSIININTQGDNAANSPNFASATLTVSGIGGTSAVLYSDVNCTNPLVANSITYPVNATAPYGLGIYLKDNKAENLTINVADNSGVMTGVSANQAISIIASTLTFAGPASVVSGQCSTAFTINLKDSAGNLVNAPANQSLTINGLTSSTTGAFYTSSNCPAGQGSNSTLTVPQGASTIQVYFKDSKAESLNVFISDPTSKMTNSNTLNIGISPSAFGIVALSGGVTSAKTTVCSGPFKLQTLDGSGSVTAAISTITASLTGAGTSGAFYADSSCAASTINSFVFATGDSVKNFYFKGQYPGTFTFTATDTNTVLTSATLSFGITAAPGYIGTSANNTVLSWFATGQSIVAPRQNGPQTVGNIHVESTGKYLYVSDPTLHRVHKFDYINHTYVGWVGQYYLDSGNNVYPIANDVITGSSLANPGSAACIATVHGGVTPGWCLGGNSWYSGTNTTGAMRDPRAMTDDGTYLYVVGQNSMVIQRFNLATGAFAGYIGRMNAAATSGAAGCTTTSGNNQTPGWCIGGQNASDGTYGYNNPGDGTGVMWYPRTIATDGSYLYVGTRGAIMKYDMNGVYQGWIGYFGTTHATGGASGCTTGAANTVTPGWCTGGTFSQVNAKTSPGGINDPGGLVVIGGTLYVLHGDNGGEITSYNATTGAYTGGVTNMSTGVSMGWNGNNNGLTTDGTYLYVLDWNRILRVDTSGIVQGWVGKISSVAGTGTGNPVDCTTYGVNQITPGWCLGGGAKYGIEEGALAYATGIDFDFNGNILAGGSNYNGQGTQTNQYYNFNDQNPAIERWTVTTGAYNGSMGYISNKLNTWSNSSAANDTAPVYGYDDASMNQPEGMYNDGTYLYIAELKAARIKKVVAATGKLVGWIGGITTYPTGGAAGCVPGGGNSVSLMSFSPGWCTGALPVTNFLWNTIIPYTNVGIMHTPVALTGDGTYLYVLDQDEHRIQKYNAATGRVRWMGWRSEHNSDRRSFGLYIENEWPNNSWLVRGRI